MHGTTARGTVRHDLDAESPPRSRGSQIVARCGNARGPMHTTDVLVVGGGFTGLALAAALCDGSREIVVLEARTGPDRAFRGELIHPPGARELDVLGFLPDMRHAGGVDVRGFSVVPDTRTEAVKLPYDPLPIGGGPGFAMDHRRMVEVMRANVARRPRVTLKMGERATEILRDGDRVVGVRTATGNEHRAKLVLIAEGRLSKLRGQLGLDGRMDLLSYSVALLAEGAELPTPGYGHVVIGAPGPLLAYPIGGAVRFCIDVPVDTDRGRAAIEDRLRREYAPVLPALLRDAMLRALDAGELELCATQQLRTSRCVGPGVALVGDAVGCSHPITAAGMTICLNDVRTLATALEQHGYEGGLGDALATYERERYRYVRAREILTERLYDVFLGNHEGMRALRDGMLDYWHGTSRARVASMALLAGRSTSVVTFAREFGAVFGYAARAAVRRDGPRGPRSLLDRARVVAEMTGATLDTLARSAKTVLAEARR
jgi:2-polyprenyl-6-methoxyphenol hydroxylase-like FAD-dependent oxidoreductase